MRRGRSAPHPVVVVPVVVAVAVVVVVVVWWQCSGAALALLSNILIGFPPSPCGSGTCGAIWFSFIFINFHRCSLISCSSAL